MKMQDPPHRRQRAFNLDHALRKGPPTGGPTQTLIAQLVFVDGTQTEEELSAETKATETYLLKMLAGRFISDLRTLCHRHDYSKAAVNQATNRLTERAVRGWHIYDQRITREFGIEAGRRKVPFNQVLRERLRAGLFLAALESRNPQPFTSNGLRGDIVPQDLPAYVTWRWIVSRAIGHASGDVRAILSERPAVGPTVADLEQSLEQPGVTIQNTKVTQWIDKLDLTQPKGAGLSALVTSFLDATANDFTALDEQTQAEEMERDAEMLLTVLRQLTKTQRHVFGLRYENGLTSRQIARQLRKPLNTIEVHLSNIRTTLRTLGLNISARALRATKRNSTN
jgi:RNA polymerase sigma factor (sigma-70 family)